MSSSLALPTLCRQMLSCTLQRRATATLQYNTYNNNYNTGRSLATKANGSKKKKGDTATTDPAPLTRQQKKDALKAIRRQKHEFKVERRAGMQDRRRGRPERGMHKAVFNEWFQRRLAFQEMHDRKARQQGRPFSIKIACVVERLPVVTPDKEKWQTDFEELQAYLGQFGRKYPADTPFATPDDDQPPAITDQDVLDRLPENLKPLPRVTEADETNDVQSLNRKLMHRLFLTTISADPNNRGQIFPTVELQQEETMVEAAKRAARETFGEDLDLWNPGNCPMAVDMRLYNDYHNKKNEFYGEKTFFFRVQRMGGELKLLGDAGDDYAWLSREEVVERVTEDVGESVAKLHHYLL